MKQSELKRALYPGPELWVEFLGPNYKPGLFPRRVAKVNTVSVAFDTGNGLSWLQWPKASELRSCACGFEIMEEGVAILRYTFRESTCDH